MFQPTNLLKVVRFQRKVWRARRLSPSKFLSRGFRRVAFAPLVAIKFSYKRIRRRWGCKWRGPCGLADGLAEPEMFRVNWGQLYLLRSLHSCIVFSHICIFQRQRSKKGTRDATGA